MSTPKTGDSSGNKKEKLKNAIQGYFNEDINNSAEAKSNNDKFSFKNMFQSTVQSLTSKFLSILTYYFDKYSEDEFHQKMNNRYAIKDGKTHQNVMLTGFDFIGDFKKFHAMEFRTFIFMFSRHKAVFNFNEERIMTTLVTLFQTKGWDVSPIEMQGIRTTVRRLHNILYNKYDGI